MTAPQRGTMLRFYVGVLAGRDQALDERDYLIGVLTAAGAKLILTGQREVDDGTEVLLTLNPADRPAPGLRDRLTAHVAALRADAETLRAAARDRTTALGGDPDWHAAGDLEMRADELDALLDVTPPSVTLWPTPWAARTAGQPAPPDPSPDGQCTASSWGAKSHAPYGPGGCNRCTLDASYRHERHLDNFGNVFLFNPGGKPRVKVLRQGSTLPPRGGGDPR